MIRIDAPIVTARCDGPKCGEELRVRWEGKWSLDEIYELAAMMGWQVTKGTLLCPVHRAIALPKERRRPVRRWLKHKERQHE